MIPLADKKIITQYLVSTYLPQYCTSHSITKLTMSNAKYKLLQKTLSFSLQELRLEIDKLETNMDWVSIAANWVSQLITNEK